jgi:hypothetical protein
LGGFFNANPAVGRIRVLIKKHLQYRHYTTFR